MSFLSKIAGLFAPFRSEPSPLSGVPWEVLSDLQDGEELYVRERAVFRVNGEGANMTFTYLGGTAGEILDDKLQDFGGRPITMAQLDRLIPETAAGPIVH